MCPILLKTGLAGLLALLLYQQLPAQNAFTNDGASIYLENAATLYVQGDLENKTSGSFTNNGVVSLTGNLFHNGSTNLNAANSGLFHFTGFSNQIIGGSKKPNFYSLTVDKTAGECSLQTGLSLSHYLTFTSGNIFLNNQEIDLLNSGSLINETASNRIYDLPTGTGTLKIVQLLNAPSSVNPGNLGAMITSGANWGSTTITRGHAQQFIISGNSIARYYDIVPSLNTGLNASLRFHYFDNELNNQPESELVQWHSTMNHIIWIKRGGSLNATSNFVDLSGIDSFSRVSLISHKIIPLPLKLLTFTANKTTLNKVLLQWKTAEEINCSHFDVERSEDGRHWKKTGVMAAVGQPGAITSYQFTDQSPLVGANYYRLKQVDLDAKFEYSPVRLINFNPQSAPAVYPTLTRPNSILFISGVLSEKTIVEIYDNAGHRLLRTKLFSNSITLPSLPAGSYQVKVIDRTSQQVAATQQILIY